jgi:bromodomain-containing factor 1
MDEDVEAEKIRQLEQRMALFEQPTVPTPTTRNVDSDHSSDSSDEDSSGSDSE